ncbi:hypothetical protein HHI36_010649, partial [Cryptolaemus montrouzieri]
SQSPMRKKCGGDHSLEQCDQDETKCLHCHGNHLSTDNKICPEFSKQQRNKKIIAHENIPYREAQEKDKDSYSTAVRNNFPKPSSNNFTAYSKKRRITQIEPSMSEELRRTHHEIISFPISKVRGAGLTNSSNVNDRFTQNIDKNDIVKFIIDTFNAV